MSNIKTRSEFNKLLFYKNNQFQSLLNTNEVDSYVSNEIIVEGDYIHSYTKTISKCFNDLQKMVKLDSSELSELLTNITKGLINIFKIPGLIAA